MLNVPLGVAGCLAAFRLSRSAMEGELARASSSLCCSMSLSGLRVAWQPVGLDYTWGDSYGLQEV
ncbi:hypothetical protein DPMN_022240 [Dreissena polymorpha]|uniref:Uncharacterized protein n=1 Tax=Dreissena polymorpha TaxID=45954 RepID=A0A9D4NNJ7_DREPO|nr:hypothetical protein DPMN_022240 [Dreissena polymorpha]